MNNLFYAVAVIFLFNTVFQPEAEHIRSYFQEKKPELNKREGNPVKLKKLGYIAPQRSENISAAPWGVEFNALPPHINYPVSEINMETLGAEIDAKLEKAAELGIKWARVSVSWTSVEDQNRQLEWEFLDKVISGLKQRNIEPYICINGGHPVYTKNLPPTVNQEGLEAWVRMTEAMVQRYKDQVRYWEIWNEPNYESFWKPKPDPAAYVQLVQQGAKAIKAVQPDAVIIGGSMARLDEPYAKDLFALGIAEYIDVLTYHPYDEFPEATAKKRQVSVQTPVWYLPSSHQVQELQQLIADSGKKIQLWQGECGYPSAGHSKGWTGSGPWGENIQAKWLLRRALTDLSSGMGVSAYFILEEYKMGGGLNSKGLLKLNTGKEKPAYRAYQSLTSLIDDTCTLKHDTKANFMLMDQGVFYGMEPEDIKTLSLSKSDGQDVFFYWLPWRSQELMNPAQASLTLQGVTVKDPVLLDLLTGEVYQLPVKAAGSKELQLEELPVFDYPVAVLSRNSIRLL